MVFKMHLSDLVDGTLPTEPIESLEVCGWRTVWWKNIHNIALAHLCNKFRVKRLVFSEDVVRTGFYDHLAKHAKTMEFPYLPHLRTFDMDFSETTSSIIQRFVDKSKVTKVLCNMVDELDRDELMESCDFFLRSFDSNNLHLREIRFWYPWDSSVGSFKVESGGILRLTPRLSKVLVMLERNQKAFQKCQKATLAILGLKRRPESRGYRDLLSLLASFVWSTKETKVWIQG